MIKKSVLAITIVAMGLLVGFKAYDADNIRSARVAKVQGYYVFTDSEPVGEYESIGIVKASMGFNSGQYTAVRGLLIKKAQKEYPDQGNGLIFNFVNGGTDTAEIIQIKE